MPFAILLTAAAVTILFIKKPYINYEIKTGINSDKFNIILIFIFASICIRGLAGFMFNYPWKASNILIIIFTMALALGKALGGILGDRFGWSRITIYGLLISAPLLALGVNMPLLGILGVFFFNLTMPVTLVVIADILPGRSGFAFGLTTLALIIGAFPTFTELRPIFYGNNRLMIFGTVIFMTVLLKIGLKAFFSVYMPETDSYIIKNMDIKGM